ncbi:hypothetical protein RHGRI_001095 [Rhododendron griersonianum]|uniref:Uncharacterized protein n=1 Tax=Rhododendron griersonianum TaxID=479676 RepID=A0AAV6LJA2_9ERIC|nr:hypothetical protein RHGRI_001095 [Rhododendron griersonianum]
MGRGELLLSAIHSLNLSVAIFGKFGFFSNAEVKIELSPYALILELSVVFIMVGGLGSAAISIRQFGTICLPSLVALLAKKVRLDEAEDRLGHSSDHAMLVDPLNHSCEM